MSPSEAIRDRPAMVTMVLPFKKARVKGTPSTLAAPKEDTAPKRGMEIAAARYSSCSGSPKQTETIKPRTPVRVII